MRKSNYDKFPATTYSGHLIEGWNEILKELQGLMVQRPVLAIDTYAGVYEDSVLEHLHQLPYEIIGTRELMKDPKEVEDMTRRFITDDVLFGYVTCLRMTDYFVPSKLEVAREHLKASSAPVIVFGPGAALVTECLEGVTLVYMDMSRWEIQQRFRRHEVQALGIDNHAEAVSLQYKRGYFNDWRVLDYYKDKLLTKVDYWIDTVHQEQPKLIDRETFLKGLELTSRRPFRVVPFFDPAPWGGQWMKQVCDLPKETPNYGWCFDCVPEENSLLLRVNGVDFEIPSQDLILYKSRQVLGERVEARFGKDFPIRFDFLDTIGGGNLSLQVHPTTQFIRESFGMSYTQDESYYLLDAEEGATVYLGLKEGIHPQDMLDDLRKSQREGVPFDAERYVNRLPAKKHDHYLIPGGTVHCSGAGALVLEISSTPNIFTFKLYDWGRMGLDGKPRPINIERGSKVIDFGRDTKYVKSRLANQVTPVAEGDGWREERTGLHENEFIETRRHWFSKPVTHHTDGSVNVLNLIEGEEAVVESPTGAFEPYVVHYAETFIIPACVDEYTIRPYGKAEGTTCGTIKASVRR